MKRLHPVIMTERPLRFVKTDGTKHRLLPFWGTLFCRQTDILSNITPQASAHSQGAWQRLEVRVTALAAAGNIAVYVLTGPLFERLTAPLPSGPLLERVPSAYWKVIATDDGLMGAFIFDQRTPRGAEYCAMRASLLTVTLRSRLVLLAGSGTPVWRPLDPDLDCTACGAARSSATLRSRDARLGTMGRSDCNREKVRRRRHRLHRRTDRHAALLIGPTG